MLPSFCTVSGGLGFHRHAGLTDHDESLFNFLENAEHLLSSILEKTENLWKVRAVGSAQSLHTQPPNTHAL